MLVRLHGNDGTTWLITSLSAFAKVAAKPPEGGWNLVEFYGLGKISEDDAKNILRHTGQAALKLNPNTAQEWERVAHCAINVRAV